MKLDARHRLKKALLGKTITTVDFSDSHGMVVLLTLSDGTNISICTYDDEMDHWPDEFYIGINGKDVCSNE